MATDIQVYNNGPVLVKGEFTLKDADGNDFNLEGRESIALCRCGHSANKPFCDGAHKAAGFESECSAS